MMSRKITMMALLLLGGVVLGAAATEGYNVYRQFQGSYRRSRDSQMFQERLHCKAVADAYVKKNTDLNDNRVTGTSVTLDKVDYSPARNSCVAEVETRTYFKGGGTDHNSVQDLLSGETLFSVDTTDDDLGMFRLRFLPRVWDHVMNNTSEPVELENEWALVVPKHPRSAQEKLKKAKALQALIESQNLPKSTFPSLRPPLDPSTAEPIRIDPTTGERIQVPASQHK